MNKARKQAPKVKRIKEVLKEAKEEVEKLIPYLKEQIDTCDEVGKKAHEAKHILPKQIFDNYHQGPKKTAEEIQAMG